MDSTHIEKIIERDVNSLGCILWGVEFSGRLSNQTLRVFIDKDNGISIEDCEKVSNHISKVLDAEEGLSEDYSLEVSSPGLDRKFFKVDQYKDYKDSVLKVKFLTSESKYKTIIGRLTEVGESSILIQEINDNIEIGFDSIKKSILYSTEV